MSTAEVCMDVADAETIIARLWREHGAPPPKMTVSEWAEKNRVLSGKDSAEPGPYRVSRTPYAREPMDCLSAHSPVEEVVLMWGAQTAKTTIGSNWLGYTADLNPGPVMIVQPTIDMAKRYSRQRLSPMIDESPVLREKVRENRSRDDANTTLLKEFAGGFMAVAGANSAAGLRSMPVRDLFLDEIDGYPRDVDGEGDPCQLAEARQTTFARRKRLKTSTPTTKDMSRIEEAYLASDRCRYHVPCPHCGELQVLEWGADKDYGVKWDRDAEGKPVPGTVRYVCRHHGCEIREHHKAEMLAAGVWVPEVPGAAGGKVRGFHLSSLYSPLGWLSWSELVQEWHAAVTAARSGDPSLLRVFVNTRLAETFEEQGDRASEHELRKRARDIPLRVVQWGLYVMTMGVDVQGDRLEAYLWAWGRGMERQLVDRAIFYGDPALPESEAGSPWASLTEYRRTPVLHASGKPVPLLATMIDTGGHHTQAVYSYCRAHQHSHVYAVKGQSQSGKAILGKPTDQDVSAHGFKLRRGVKLWPVGTDSAKSEIYGRLRLTEPGPGYVHLSKHLPGEVFEQLTAERLVTRYVKGHAKLEWVKPAGRRNEALDCAVYALAAAHWAGIDRWREGDWAKWRSRVEETDLFDQAPPAHTGVGPAAAKEKPQEMRRKAGQPTGARPAAPVSPFASDEWSERL
ncbi:phage terminase large subunit family protein [Thermoleptolyngbya sichuanensis XZ-Cy5]|nr:phage terminase large subunit family protein [Thermoleptolyngbya sichuanensis XZ-Cy5]